MTLVYVKRSTLCGIAELRMNMFRNLDAILPIKSIYCALNDKFKKLKTKIYSFCDTRQT